MNEDTGLTVGGISENYGDSALSGLLYSVTVIVAMLMLAHFSPRRDRFVVRLITCAVVILGFSVAANVLINMRGYGTASMWLHMAKFFIVFALSGVTAKVCFACGRWEALFFAVAGYCLQHIGGRVGSVFDDFIFPDFHWALNGFLVTLITFAVYAAFYFVYIKRRFSSVRPAIANRAQLFIAVCVVSFSIVYNTFGISYATQVILRFESLGLDSAVGYDTLLFVYIMTMIVAFLTFALSVESNYVKHYEEESVLLNHMLEERRRQYENDKANVELLNMRMHDLKHYIGSLDEETLKNKRADILETIDKYDVGFSVGNDMLDTLLTQKNIQCVEAGIRLNCMIKGAPLGNIPNHELYALFCNAVDNAMDAVKELPEPKRVISITARKEGEYTAVEIENYFSGALKFVGDLPASTKQGLLHGLGVKSMKHIAEKYGGHIRVNAYEDVFCLQIYIKNNR